jgi:hypothetical protein
MSRTAGSVTINTKDLVYQDDEDNVYHCGSYDTDQGVYL